MSNRPAGTHKWGLYSELSRATHKPQTLNSDTTIISKMITAHNASESYQGEMVFLNSGVWSNLIIRPIACDRSTYQVKVTWVIIQRGYSNKGPRVIQGLEGELLAISDKQPPILPVS